MGNLSWAEVADDLLFLLAERLVGITAFIRFSVVCKSWLSIASSGKCSYKPVPWLMLSEKEGSDLRDFYDHSTGEVCQLPLAQARGLKNVGSAHGWLITAGEDGNFRLLNPLTRTQIALPPRTAFQNARVGDFKFTPRDTRDIFMIKATCSPIGPNGDYIVAATHMGRDNWLLSFCRSTDKEWTGFQILGVKEVAFVGGAFYILAFGEIYSCDFSSTPKLIKIGDLPQDALSMCWNGYIVECAGDILVVVKKYKFYDGVHYTEKFRIFKLDVEGKKLVEVRSIGDYALFLGRNNYICLSTTSYNELFKRNCIYFTDDRHNGFNVGNVEAGDDMGIFNLEDGSLTTHYPGVSKSLYSFPIWLTVNTE